MLLSEGKGTDSFPAIVESEGGVGGRLGTGGKARISCPLVNGSGGFALKKIGGIAACLGGLAGGGYRGGGG